MSDSVSFDTELNPAREPIGQEQGMKNVLYAPTKTVGAFPINTSDQDIQAAFEQYNSQRPQEDVNPNMYNAIVKPALDQAKITGDNSVIFDANRRVTNEEPFNNFLTAGATFGLAQNKDIESQGEAELHPGQAIAGNLVGQIGSILGTAGFGAAFGMEKVAAGLGLAARGATPLAIRASIAGSGDVLANQTVGKAIQGTVQAVSSNAMLGMVYNGITEAARQGKSMFDDSEGNIKQQAPDLVKFGEKTLSGLGWGPWGVGAPFAAESITGLMNGTAAVFSTAYLLSKASGQDEPDSVLNATLGAAMHFVGVANHSPEQARNIIESTQNAIADYVKAKNQSSGVGNVNELVAKELMDNEVQGVVDQSNQGVIDRNPSVATPEKRSVEPLGPGGILLKSASQMEQFNAKKAKENGEPKIPGQFTDPHDTDMMDYLAQYIPAREVASMSGDQRLELANGPWQNLRDVAAKYESGQLPEKPAILNDKPVEITPSSEKLQNDIAARRSGNPIDEVSKSPILINNLMNNLVSKVAPEGEQTISRAEAMPTKDGIDDSQEIQYEGQHKVSDVGKESAVSTGKVSDSGEKLAGQEPVSSEGEEKESRLSQRVADKLDEEFKDKPIYNELNTKETAQKAIDLQKSDPDLVARVANGIESAPDGYSETALRFAHREALKEAGKNDEANAALNSASLRGTRLGQEVNLYKLYKNGAEHDPDDFVKKAIQDRIKSVNKELAKTFKEIDNQKSDITKRLNDAKLSDDDIQKVIDSIIC